MNVLGRNFLNSRKDRRKDGKMERRKDGVFCEMQKNLYLNNNINFQVEL